MAEITLNASVRESGKHSARVAREKNTVPAVMYGSSFDNTPVAVPYSEMLKGFRKAGFSTLVDIDVDGKKVPALIQDINIHPVRHTIEHVDFYVVNMKETTTVNVPIVTVGESPAVKVLGGILMVEMDSIELRCLPGDIMQEIKVDISIIEDFAKHITVADLGLDEKKYEIMGTEMDAVVCTVVPQKVETEAGMAEEGEAEATE